MKGLELCEGFFEEAAKPILDRYFPELNYSAGLIGYGSDVLGYDDEVSRDHMWGPRFYLFLEKQDICRRDEVFRILSENLPYMYKGFSVNFSRPDPDDNGVMHPEPVSVGPVNPLIFITTPEEFLESQLGTSDLENLSPTQWLTFSEHRLLSLISGTMFVDGLKLRERLKVTAYYPEAVRDYLIASNWDIIASEQAFVRRCADCGDDMGSRIICARMAERLMRLCFLYRKTYAPYSKWFGTAFARLDVDENIGRFLQKALKADTPEDREEYLVSAQALVADLHNECYSENPVEYRIESYFSRNIRVIYADKFAQSMSERLKDMAFEGIPLMGSLSQIGGLSNVSDDCACYERIGRLYERGPGL